jgi:DTW domain-containing protein YfiP
MQRFLPVGKDAKGAARFLLAALPALRLPEAAQPTRRLREANGAQRSTLEAIAESITALGSAGDGATLLKLHARFVERSLRARGRPIA